MPTLRSELDDLLNVARESNKQLSGYMANPELNFPEIEPEDELNENESYLLCGHCDGLGCYYCRNTGVMHWPFHDTLSEEGDRDEIK
jgi:hypothetical protein